jgi:glycosyltransferase involved in cell wall biosynthesis
LHIHDIQIAQAVFKSNRKKGLKIILDLHENRPEIMKFYPHLQKFPGKWLIAPSMWKRKEEEFIKKSDKIVVVTEEAKSEICDRTGCAAQKVLVVPNTVSRNFGTHKIDDKASSAVKRYKNLFTILYIGDTGKRRGLSMVISSISLLKKSIEQIKLVIVGSSTFDNQLKDQVNALGLKDYVDFEGWQDESTFPDYIAASDVCVSPLHRNKHHDTTYANKIFQYMSMGKPVLVSDATAQKNIVEKHYTGLAHRAEDPDDFSKKLLKLFTNPELAKAFGERGMKFVNNEFYWEKTSQKLVDLYRNLYR